MCSGQDSIYIYISIVILTRSAAVASFHSHSIFIVEPNLTEVDVSQVQHLDPNYLYIYTVGPNFWETHVYIHPYRDILIYIYRHIPTPP